VSKKIVDKIIQEAYGTVVKKHVNKLARQRVDNSGLHFISITQQDIFDVLVYNYVAIKRPKMVRAEVRRLKESKEDDFSRATAARNVITSDSKLAQQLREEASKVSKLIFQGFVEEYNSKVANEENKAIRVGSEIRILQPRNQADRIKDTLFNLLSSKSSDTLLNSLTRGKEKKSFTRRTQFLHIGKTVGTQIIEDLTGAASRIEFDTTAKNAAIAVLSQMMSEVQFDWSSADFYDGRDISVVGKIGQTLANKPGEESTDWKVLRPRLEALLLEELDSRKFKFATEKGSQPFDERMAKKAANTFINRAIKAPNITGEAFKVDKPKNKKSNIPAKKTSKNPKPGSVSIKRKKAQEKTFQFNESDQGGGLLQLQTLLNAKLPDEVRKNMGYPRLENRTGRFASSVKVTDIVRTAKGFPSIGYTYEKNPYQIFELGAGKTPWASSERDPRTLIDRSIREIASEVLVGRFYTRRV